MIEYLTQGRLDSSEDIDWVRDGLNMTLEIIDNLPSNPYNERRETLESYHQKLAEVLYATESYSTK
jgi:hypothetical protein